jgi:predicted tellurium resistance membrane protein TerC
MLEMTMAYGQIIIADLILSGDNALIIGMAAAGLAPELRKRAIFYGMVIAAVLRIVFAVIATTFYSGYAGGYFKKFGRLMRIGLTLILATCPTLPPTKL